jgi:NAD(P)-dependent dehydrogenase (short-subunit alcohol dehydrogenase family)
MPTTTMKQPPFPSPTITWHDNTYPAISPTRPELSAKGKTVLITGGGTGIGAETARSFAKAGASRIALLGRRERPLLDTKASIEREFPGVEVFVAPTDVTKKGEVDAAFAKFVGDGKLDVLVSNAAITGPHEAVRDVEPAQFLDCLQIIVGGSLYVAQAFLRHASKDATAIDVNSSAAHINFAPLFSAYSTAKMAVVRLWDSLACGSPDLNIFHIQPGVVNTDMNKETGGVKAMGFEDHGKSSQLLEHCSSPVCLTTVTDRQSNHSVSPCRFQCLACQPRGPVLEGQVLMGELGRR